jgi:hypothetical protein
MASEHDAVRAGYLEVVRLATGEPERRPFVACAARLG